MRRLYRYIFNLRSNKVTPIVFPNPRKKFDNCNCSISLENLIHDKVNLPCGHSFHSNCILTWFNQEMNCPICKMKIQWSLINIKQ